MSANDVPRETLLNFIELLAAYCHDKQWSGWMKYILERGVFTESGDFLILKRDIDRWGYQTYTEFKDLPEEMKESDRKEAVGLLKAIETFRI